MDQTAFHKLLMFGVERGVSDIHFEVGYPPHYRLQGELLGAVKVPPSGVAVEVGAVLSILTVTVFSASTLPSPSMER